MKSEKKPRAEEEHFVEGDEKCPDEGDQKHSDEGGEEHPDKGDEKHQDEGDEKSLGGGDEERSEEGDEKHSGGGDTKSNLQEEAEPAHENPGPLAKGKEKRTISSGNLVGLTATQRKAARRQAKKAKKPASPAKSPAESTTEVDTPAASSENEGDSSGRTTTWFFNLVHADANTDEKKRENIRAMLALLAGTAEQQAESSARGSHTYQQGTVLGVCNFILSG